ncbi:MAG: AAA family ATPase, partial [Gemmatimonadota bacterium]|nr:AAA family ATPase [Gemmatimonadota bacterium]
MNELRESTQQLRSEIAVATERQRNALSRRERAEEERREGDVAADRVSIDLERAAKEHETLEAALRDADAALALRTSEEETFRATLIEARSALEQREYSLRDLREQLHRVTLDTESGERERTEVSARRATLEAELTHLFDAAEAARRELAEAEDAAAVAAARSAETAAAAESARNALQQARQRDVSARAELLRTEELHTALEGKMNALESLERERVGLAPAAARLLKERAMFEEGAIIGPLSDYLTTDTSAASLVERFLGPTVNAILVRDRAAAEAIRAWHASAAPGPLLLLPLDAMEQSGSVDSSDDLAALVSADKSSLPWVRALLGKVTSLEGGNAFVDARGAIWLPGTNTGPGPLHRRAEISELRQAAANSAQARQSAIVEAERERAAVAAAERGAAAADEAAALAGRSGAEAADRSAAVARTHQRTAKEAAEAKTLIERLVERESAATARLTSLSESSAELSQRIWDEEVLIKSARESLIASETRHDEAREQRTSAQVKRAQVQAQLQVADDRRRHLTEEFASAKVRVESLQTELFSLSEADSQLSTQLANWQTDLDARQRTLETAEERLAEAELAVKRVDEDLNTTEHTLAEMRRHSLALSEELHAAELRFTELSGRKTAIRERLETEWKKPLEELLQSAETIEVDDDALRADAEAARGELDALGPVNPLAIEEHEEETKRLDFLTTQRADLVSGRASLQQAIREIDATARDLFLTAFVKVRENFRNIFMTLFGGGECDLRLENPESPLEGDIEIHASPRGKRTQRIHLLSSGERALVALSLLFGIFLTKPSPFCLLDEVDAPLDDQNIGHFVRMLNRFKDKTQFIVITHNPRTTTEAADAVYGVTMQEPGVSSLVSVRMRGPAVDGANPTSRPEEIGAGAA